MAKRTEQSQSIVAGLDIGSTKVVFAIATVSEEGYDIVGVGTAPSTGMRQGVVVNIEETTNAIRKAKEEAELMSGYSAERVFVGVAGNHIQSFDSVGMVAIRNQEVTDEDIDRVIEAAKAVAVPTDREVIHVLPREYKIDEQDGINDPIGMSGVRLEASVHIVTGGQTALQNAIKCTEKAGLIVNGLVLQPLASAMAILSEDEKKLGVAVIDMGGGTCDTVIYLNGSVAHTSVLPVGGSHFTHDLAVGLRTPQLCAEDLKKKFGAAMADLIDPEEMVEVEGVGGREPRNVYRRHLCEVIEPRAEETLKLLNEQVRASGKVALLGSGIVLTGGASQLEGLSEMGEFLFDVPVRKGAPVTVRGLSDIVRTPEYATAVGLIAYALEQENRPTTTAAESLPLQGIVGGWSQKLKDLLSGN